MNATPAPPPEPASGEDAAHRYDPRQRLTTARLQHANQHWLLMWGPHSRRYYAYPLFAAPSGTIISASDPDRLLTRCARQKPPPPPTRKCHRCGRGAGGDGRAADLGGDHPAPRPGPATGTVTTHAQHRSKAHARGRARQVVH